MDLNSKPGDITKITHKRLNGDIYTKLALLIVTKMFENDNGMNVNNSTLMKTTIKEYRTMIRGIDCFNVIYNSINKRYKMQLITTLSVFTLCLFLYNWISSTSP